MELFEHESYRKDIRDALRDVPNVVLAKGRPQKIVVGAEKGRDEGLTREENMDCIVAFFVGVIVAVVILLAADKICL